MQTANFEVTAEDSVYLPFYEPCAYQEVALRGTKSAILPPLYRSMTAEVRLLLLKRNPLLQPPQSLPEEQQTGHLLLIVPRPFVNKGRRSRRDAFF